MIKMRRPELIPSLFFIAAFTVCCALGIWQMQRLAWKEAIIADTEAKKQMPALANLPQDISGLEYRNAILTGKLLNDEAMFMIGRQMGMESGYYVVTPLVLEDDGRIILVNRGFATPDKHEHPGGAVTISNISKPEGITTVSGLLRPLREKRYFSPKNDPVRNIWSYEDIKAVGEKLGQEPLPLVLEVVGEHEKGISPMPNDGQVIFRNDHLGYAVTWFGLALVSVVMFIAYYKKKS